MASQGKRKRSAGPEFGGPRAGGMPMAKRHRESPTGRHPNTTWYQVVCWDEVHSRPNLCGGLGPTLYHERFESADDPKALGLADRVRVHLILQMLEDNYDTNPQNHVRLRVAEALREGTIKDYFDDMQASWAIRGLDCFEVAIRPALARKELLAL